MHLLNFKEWDSRRLEKLIDSALHIKKKPEKYIDALKGCSLAMIFQKTSTRTRVAFEVAMYQMGGHALYIDWRTTQFTMADIKDETRYLSRNVNGILARVKKHEDLRRMAEASLVPVINGCCEKYHPTQAVADLMTMKEKKGYLKGLKLVYIGVHNNVCNSLIEACTKLGVKITTVTPIINEASIDSELLEEAEKTGLYSKTENVRAAMLEADFVYTDTWVDMEFFQDPSYKPELDQRTRLMKPYQINAELLKGSKAMVMHDMPIHRDYEISDEVVDSPQSIIFDQSENRLYSAKSVLLHLLT